MSDDTVRMKVSALSVDPVTGLPVVLLIDEQCRSTLSVAVGLGEASGIAAKLGGIELEHPNTHQLMGTLLGCAGVEVERVEIHGLIDHRFCARIHLVLPSGEKTAQEGRSSDILALALHMNAEIRVAAAVLAAAGQPFARGAGPLAEPTDEPLHYLPGDLPDSLADDWADDEIDEPAWGPVVGSTCASSSVGDPELADFSDEAFGKWKM